MSDKITIGDIVKPRTSAGLCLADVPVDGDYKQNLKTTCIFRGEGEVIAVNDIIIDYSSWGGLYSDVGEVEYRSCLISCENGEGWGGEGALIKVEGK